MYGKGMVVSTRIGCQDNHMRERYEYSIKVERSIQKKDGIERQTAAIGYDQVDP